MDNLNRIQFEAPNLDALTNRHTVVDLHFHSHFSDGADAVDEIAQRARQLGIGVAITDHNAIDGAVELDGVDDVLSIPGIEVTSLEGTHVLVYFYRIDDLKAFYAADVQPHMGSTVMSSIELDVESILRRARKYKSVVIFPHPYSAAFTGICNHSFSDLQLHRLLGMADGVEVINSENLKGWNLKSALLGFNLDRAITGGSDGHSIQQLGSAVTYAACDRSRKAFLDALSRKEAKVVGTESKLLKKIQSNGAKLKNSINNYPDLVEKNIRYGKSVIHFRSRRVAEKIWRRINDKHLKKAFYFVAGLTFLKINYNALPLIMFSLIT
ncbi:MAG: PHP domain-containing protein [Desulfosarcina sp.]|nr:PHP domain-containing protein [Desulfosarcina sp.]MBC2767604.1 PHP domain-containing protein [Desulfosarcina sp.]